MFSIISRTSSLTSVFVAIALVIVGCSSSSSDNSAQVGSDYVSRDAETIVEVIEDLDRFSVLQEAMSATGFDSTDRLSGPGEYTFFAINNDAFVKLLQYLNMTKGELIAQPELLIEILNYHTLEFPLTDTLRRNSSTTPLSLTTLADENFSVLSNSGQEDDPQYYINTSLLRSSGIKTSNGTVHEISNPLLLPLTFNPYPELNLADLIDALANDDNKPRFTILNESINATKGLRDASFDIDARLRILESEHTIFAPTDEAFERFFEVANLTKEKLLDNPYVLSRVLKRHIGSGSFLAQELYMLNGKTFYSIDREAVNSPQIELNLEIKDSDLYVEKIPVIEADLFTDDGVIHTVDDIFFSPNDPTLLRIR